MQFLCVIILHFYLREAPCRPAVQHGRHRCNGPRFIDRANMDRVWIQYLLPFICVKESAKSDTIFQRSRNGLAVRKRRVVYGIERATPYTEIRVPRIMTPYPCVDFFLTINWHFRKKIFTLQSKRLQLCAILNEQSTASTDHGNPNIRVEDITQASVGCAMMLNLDLWMLSAAIRRRATQHRN